MRAFDLEVKSNEFVTRSDLEKYMDDLFEPLEKAFIRNNTRVHFINTSSGCPDSVSGVEGFSRIIWGLAAHQGRGPEDSMWQRIRQGLIHGTDPDDPDYFGKPTDYDQRIVEMAAIGFAFVLRPDCIYDPLSDKEKDNLVAWLDTINHVKAHECNWKFFRVMVNVGFKALGLPYNKKKMEAYLDDMDAYYIGDGWYTDGHPDGAHVDYYIPWAMQFYGLFYSMHMKDVDPRRCERYEDRAKAFASEFVHWFAPDGAALPYGRSLVYRYAQTAFWSIFAASGIETEITLGQMKGIILRNLRWWHEKPIYDMAGYLTVGYAYPNMFMAEDYSAPGSLYWCLKSMLIAALPDDHDFWLAEEESLPELNDRMVVEPARLVIARNRASDQIIAYNGGNFHTNGHIHVECKYEKFAYSTVFGFSAPRSYRTLGFGAYDCTLAVSKDGNYYRHKDKSSMVDVSESLIHSRWQPFGEVTIDTYLIPGFPWHVRIHRISTRCEVQTAEGGYAFGLGEVEDQHLEYLEGFIGEHGVGVSIDQYSGIADLTGNQTFEMVKAASNTNIMRARTAIPTLKATLPAGEHWIASFVFGDRDSFAPPSVPAVAISDDFRKINVHFEDKVYSITL